MTEFAIEEGTKAEVVPEVKVETKKVEQKPESDIEKLATKIGWNPNGTSESGEQLDAKGFILKSRDIQSTMRKHINEQKNQLSNLGNSVEELKTHHKTVQKAASSKFKKELSALKKEKTEAIEEGDVEKVSELDDQIDEVEEAIKEPKEAEYENPEFASWVNKNAWYIDSKDMAAYADSIASQYEGAPFSRASKLIETKVKEMFPDEFKTAEKKVVAQASPVEGSTRKTTTTKFTKADLSDSQKTIMKQFVNQGIMTEKQYISDISETQGV